jgi:hypothetical protein
MKTLPADREPGLTKGRTEERQEDHQLLDRVVLTRR